MATTDPETDDELDDLEDSYKKRPLPVPVGERQRDAPIGSPIATGSQVPLPSPQIGSSVAPSQSAPQVESTPPPMPGTSTIGSNIAAPMTPQPHYHGLNRFLDTIAGATKIGSAIEGASGLGTKGWEAQNEREQGQIEQGQEQRAANAAEENVGAEAQQKEAETGLAQAKTAQIGKTATVTVNGVTYNDVPIAQLGTILRGQGSDQTRKDIAGETNQTREDIAGQNNQTKVGMEGTREASNQGIAAGHNAAEITAAGVRNTTPRSQIMYVPQPDGSYQAIQVNPGSTVPAGTETAGGVNTMSTPTAQSRNMGQMAASVMQQVPRVKEEVKNLAAKLGPAAGRWNQAYVNGVGADDPDFSGLDTDLDLLASAIVRTHFGAKGGQAYQGALKKQFTEAQSPDDLISRIDHADEWLTGYAKMSGAPTGGASAPSGGGFKNWKQSQGATQ